LEVKNDSEQIIYPRVILRGVPEINTETSFQSGMSLSISYLDLEGRSIDPASLEQGTDFKVMVSVKNTGDRGPYRQVALTHLVASGFEIHNEQLMPTARAQSAAFDFREVRDDRVYTYFDLKSGEEKTFEVLLNASYLGRFYQPLISVETMYDGTINAREAGRFVEVVLPE
jgi:hypothetical protein